MSDHIGITVYHHTPVEGSEGWREWREGGERERWREEGGREGGRVGGKKGGRKEGEGRGRDGGGGREEGGRGEGERPSILRDDNIHST